MLYLISYDLYAPGKNYTPLICAIHAYCDWAKIGQSCWLIRSESTATQIRDNLGTYLDINDTLFVCSIDSWASQNFCDDVIAWLNN